MGSWKKVIVSGSDANLKSLVVSQSLSATSITGSLLGSAQSAEMVVVNSSTAPTSSLSGSLWFNTNNLTLYVRYTDPSGSTFWVPTFNAGIPVTASYSISSSFSDLSQTASYVSTATTASYVVTAQTASFFVMSNRPAFRIIGTGGAMNSSVLSGSKVTVDFNQGNHFNQTTGLFTAPITGLYQAHLVIRTNNNTNSTINQAAITKNSGGSDFIQVMIEFANNTTMNHAGGSSIISMTAGDTLRAQILVGSCSFDGNNNFSVAYIG
jgi:hypothetical protein